MPFAETYEVKTYDETQNRTAVDYVKFTEDYRTVLRMLDNNSVVVWKHFIPQANRGRGTSVVCPNISADTRVCPVELSGQGYPKDSDKYRESRARRRYIVNVLDRTPWGTCPKCDQETPKTLGNKCISCKADTSKMKFAPLNKVKLLEGGPRLFVESLNPIQQLQMEELHKDITEYDIVFTTTGSGRDRKTVGMPREVEPLDESWLLNEDGEKQKAFDLDLLVEPTPIEEITLLMEGKGYDEIRGTSTREPF